MSAGGVCSKECSKKWSLRLDGLRAGNIYLVSALTQYKARRSPRKFPMRTSKQNREDKRSEQEHHAEYCFAQAEQEQHEADYLHELDRGRGGLYGRYRSRTKCGCAMA